MNAPSSTPRADRCPAISYDEYLNRDSRRAPAILREVDVEDIGAEPVLASRYYDAGFFQKEVAFVWMKVWQFACREEEVPNPGDYMIYEVVGKSVLITRQRDGSIRAFYNACLHRGRKLATLPGCKHEFKCPYHGFTWNADGSFKENPLGWDFAHWTEAQRALPQVKVDSWGGFVFVNLDPEAPSLASVVAPLAEHFDAWNFEDLYISLHVEKIVRANWKTTAEAFMESHHSVTTHPQILPYLADANSQYDRLSDHVTRHFSAQMVASPLSERQYTEADIINLRFNGDGVARAARGGQEVTLPEGMTARALMADLLRKALEAADGHNYSNSSDAEMVDALLYNLFPNMSFWAGFGPRLTYRWRPNGLDPETSIMDIYLLNRVPKGGPRPPSAPVYQLGPEDSFVEHAERMGMMSELAAVFEQDMGNLPYVQEGLHSVGSGLVQFGRYSEMRLRLMHLMIDRYIDKGEAVAH